MNEFNFPNPARKPIPSGEKEKVWFKIVSHIRTVRLQQAEQNSKGLLWPVFRFRKLALGSLIAMVLVSVFGGVTKAAEGSLPGDTLYSFKKAVEKVETALARSEEKKVKVLSRQAKKRLVEVAALVAEQNPPEIAVSDTLAELKEKTEQMVEVASSADPELVKHAINLVNEEKTVLSQVQEQLKGKVKFKIQEAITASEASIAKLTQTSETVKGASEETAATGEITEETGAVSPSPVSKPKITEGVLESPVLIHDVFKVNGNRDPENRESPNILNEPSN